MDTFDLEILSAERPFYSGKCEALTVPCTDGEKGILARHEPVVMALIPGELRYTINGETKIAVVGSGFVQVSGKNTVTVLTSFAESPEEIDIDKAEHEKQLEEERLKAKTTEKEYAALEADLQRKFAEIKVVKRRMKHEI